MDDVSGKIEEIFEKWQGDVHVDYDGALFYASTRGREGKGATAFEALESLELALEVPE